MVWLLVPALQHAASGGQQVVPDHVQCQLGRSLFEDLYVSLTVRFAWSAQHGVPVNLFVNPSVTISSLEFAVRHSWAHAERQQQQQQLLQPLKQDLATGIIKGVLATLFDTFDTQQLQLFATDIKKAPVLLSLLLSCLKQCVVSTQMNPLLSLKAAGAAVIVQHISILLLQASRTQDDSQTSGSPQGGPVDACMGSSSSSSSSSSRKGSSGSAAAQTTQSVASTSSLLSGSTGIQHSPAVAADSTEASTLKGLWSLLFSRCVFTTGVALQAAQSESGSIQAMLDMCDATPSLLQTPSSAVGILRFMRNVFGQCVHWADFLALAESGGASSGSSTASGSKAGVVLPGTGPAAVGESVTAPVIAACLDLMGMVDAVADLANSLQRAALGAPADADTLAASKQLDPALSASIWRQVLGSDQISRLPELMVEAGSLLCSALPSRYCCNEPSCCCLDKASEQQLAGGKGSKCSGCGAARYCGVEHQKQHWKLHKPACKAIAAAAGGGMKTKKK